MPFPIGSRLEQSLSTAVFEILRSKRIGVTTHEFDLSGHVTLSVTWPFDAPYAIGAPFGTKPLYLTVSEIFNFECNAMVEMTLIRPLNKGHSFGTNRFLI